MQKFFLPTTASAKILRMTRRLACLTFWHKFGANSWIFHCESLPRILLLVTYSFVYCKKTLAVTKKNEWKIWKTSIFILKYLYFYTINLILQKRCDLCQKRKKNLISTKTASKTEKQNKKNRYYIGPSIFFHGWKITTFSIFFVAGLKFDFFSFYFTKIFGFSPFICHIW